MKTCTTNIILQKFHTTIVCYSIILVLFLFIIPPQPYLFAQKATNLDNQIARNIVQAVESENIDPEISNELLFLALEYNNSSDIWYLLGNLAFAANNFISAEEYIEQALILGNWETQSLNQARLIHLRSLMASSKFNEVELAYIAEQKWKGYLGYPEFIRYLIEAQYSLGNDPRELLSAALELYPQNIQYRLQSILYSKPPRVTSLRQIQEIYSDYLEISSDNSFGENLSLFDDDVLMLFSKVLLSFLFELESSPIQEQLLEFYSTFIRGSKEDPLIYILNANKNYSQVQYSTDYLIALAIVLDNLQTESLETNVEGFLQSTLSVDTNRDTLIEVQLNYNNSVLENLNLLQNNIEIHFSTDRNGNRLPNSILLIEPNRTLTITYQHYPTIHRAVLVEDVLKELPSKTIYTFQNFEYRPIEPIIQVDEYKFIEKLPEFIRGRIGIHDLLILSDIQNKTGFFMVETAKIDEFIEIFRVNQSIKESESLERISIERFQKIGNSNILRSSVHDLNKDGNFELLMINTDDNLQYQVYNIEGRYIITSFFGLESDTQILPQQSFSDLPLVVQDEIAFWENFQTNRTLLNTRNN